MDDYRKITDIEAEHGLSCDFLLKLSKRNLISLYSGTINGWLIEIKDVLKKFTGFYRLQAKELLDIRTSGLAEVVQIFLDNDFYYVKKSSNTLSDYDYPRITCNDLFILSDDIDIALHNKSRRNFNDSKPIRLPTKDRDAKIQEWANEIGVKNRRYHRQNIAEDIYKHWTEKFPKNPRVKTSTIVRIISMDLVLNARRNKNT